MPIDYEPDAPSQTVEVLINVDLLSKAEALEVNLSAVLEKALAETVALDLALIVSIRRWSMLMRDWYTS
ncbi:MULTISPECIES: type II toxin-antitoxin system CcdA family antitoxin [unclassified Pseudomonas]|uniref:type II toxin-antitoxin system CcdA family antitoxin n=1 Tax=unclassified Pseudomonas TaxID=196821 RepID=UPI001AECADC5|nr:type II toxin-antitoxin system CcdA family antitoxin [Pseudomonas sp. PNP]MBP2842165.1 type II toxin-antitoxin system CcdA family antitoxin [Pseudomonas sp. PNP]